MKDIHCHILFGIDDGSYNLEESIKIIEKAISNGYTDLLLTPHYRYNQNYTADNKKKKKYFDCLLEEVEKRELNINLYLGNEITLDNDFFYYLKTNQLLSLNNSRYLLIELPFFKKVPNLKNIIKDIMELGYVVIIAHPERYEKYSVDDFKGLVDMGVLLQGNIGSLYRKYGRDAEEKLKEMLKRHMIHFIGSDVHHEKQSSYTRIQDVKEKIERLTGSSSIAEELISTNIEKVIKNEVIKTYPVRRRVTRVKSLRKLMKIN